jgi:hypothetical protein
VDIVDLLVDSGNPGDEAAVSKVMGGREDTKQDVPGLIVVS